MKMNTIVGLKKIEDVQYVHAHYFSVSLSVSLSHTHTLCDPSLSVEGV